MNFQQNQPSGEPAGWAGWSCPADTHVVGGGVLPVGSTVFAQGPAKYGAPAIDGYNYPVYPHHTYNGGVNAPGGEEGWVVEAAGPTPPTSIYVDCLANNPDATGRLSKIEQDFLDLWKVDLKVPPVEGYVGQDWPASCPTVPTNGENYGCDLWIEVTGVSERVPYEPCTGWGCLGTAGKDFFVTGRYGDGNPTAGAWELAIWNGNPEQVEDQDNYGWGNNQAVNFSVSYDPNSGLVTYTVGGANPLTWTYSIDKAFDYIVLFAKGDGNGNNTSLTSLNVDGLNVPDVNSNNTYTGLVVYLTDAQQTDGFTVTGQAKLIWGGSPANELPAFHVFAMGTHDLPN